MVVVVVEGLVGKVKRGWCRCGERLRKARYQVDVMRMVDGWYDIDMYVIRSMTWLGFS